MVKPNPHLREMMLNIVNNQLLENNPPETNQTLIRLMQNGHSEQEAVKMIAAVIVSDIYHILKEGQEFNLPAYIAALNGLK